MLCTGATIFPEVLFSTFGHLRCGVGDCASPSPCAGRGSGCWTWQTTAGCGSARTNRRPRSPHPPCSRHCCSWSGCPYAPCGAKMHTQMHRSDLFILCPHKCTDWHWAMKDLYIHISLKKTHTHTHIESCCVTVVAYVTLQCRLTL